MLRPALVALAIAAAAPACAQALCQHSDARMAIGGIDIDELKCRLAVAEDGLARQTTAAVATEANRMMLANDLAAAKARITNLEAENAKLKAAASAAKAK